MVPALPLVKLGVSVAAGIPVSKVLTDVIKNNVTIVTKSDALKVKVGGFIISSMIAGTLMKTTDTVVDNVAEIVTTVKNRKETIESPDEAVLPEETP